MGSYFTDTIIKIDLLLLIMVGILALLILASISAYSSKTVKRNRSLLNIKKNVYGLVLSGTKLSANVCAPFSSESTPEELLAITTNRHRDAVSFTKEEQDAFRGCYSIAEKTESLKKTALYSFNKWRRIEAFTALAYLAADEAIGVLKKYIRSNDEDLRYFSIIALGQIKDPESARTLTDLVRRKDYPKRKIVSILETFPDEPTSGYTVKLLKEKDPDTRFWALKLLSRLDAGKYAEEVAKYLKDPSGNVRSAACECLGNSKQKDSAKKLSEALKDDSWLVRASAVKALSELLDKDCIPEIIGLLGDNSISVLYAVKEVLITHIDAAMPYIEKIYSGEDRMAKIICTEAVEEAKRGRPR